MKIFFRTTGYILITAFALMMVITFIVAVDYSLSSLQVKNCMKGRIVALAQTQGGMIDVGEVEICGTDMEVSPVYGPSMETHIEQLRKENAALRVQLDNCRMKQAL